MICNNCKKEVHNDAKWCNFCGAKFEEIPIQPAMNAQSPLDNATVIPVQPQLQMEDMLKQSNAAIAVQTQTQPALPVKEKKVRKIKNGLVTLLVVGVTVIGIIVGGVVYYFNSTEREIISYINDGSYDSAIKTYDKEISNSSVKKWILEKLLLANLSSYNSDYEDKKIDAETFVDRAKTIAVFGYESANKKIEEYFDDALADIKEHFIAEKITYDEARQSALTFIDSGLVTNSKEEADTILNEIDSLNISREAYTRAESFFSEADYPSAIKEYEKVIESDANYETAKQQISVCKELYKQQILSTTENYSDSEECKAAIDKVSEAMEIIGEDEDLKKRFDKLSDEYTKSIKKEAFEKADKAVKNGDYETAIFTIQESLPYCQNDKEYVDYWNTLQTEYVKSVETLASSFAEKGDYRSALNVLERACTLLPDNAELKDSYEMALANKPVGLMEIKISESDSFEQVADLSVSLDTVGNTYDPINLYKITGKKEEWSDDVNGYAKIYTNSDYKRLTGVIAVSDITENNTICDFTIYGDDKILYTVTGLSRTTAPIPVDVDLTGISWIQLQITITEGTTIELLLSNFDFFK